MSRIEVLVILCGFERSIDFYQGDPPSWRYDLPVAIITECPFLSMRPDGYDYLGDEENE